MINNSININKTSNHFSRQSNEHTKKNTTYDVENPGSGLIQAQTCGALSNYWLLVKKVYTL
jgi:hypothetical protein